MEEKTEENVKEKPSQVLVLNIEKESTRIEKPSGSNEDFNQDSSSLKQSVQTDANSISRNEFSENGNSLQDENFFDQSKNLTNHQNFVEHMMEGQRLNNPSFNLQDHLPPPPALPNANHSTASACSSLPTSLIEVKQSSQPISEQYYASSLIQISTTSTAGYPLTQSSGHSLIHTAPGPQQTSSNYDSSTTAISSPSQAFITHYPHNMNDNIVQPHVIHHRVSAEIEHFQQQHISIQHGVEGDPSIPQAIEIPHADALTMHLQQPMFDPSRSMCLYPSSMVECPGSTAMEGHHLGTDISHSSHQQVSTKMELDQNEQFLDNSLMRGVAGGQLRPRKREHGKPEEMEHDPYDSNQPVPDKTIEDILKGSPGHESKKKGVEDLLK